jgi:hypothetical protein
MRYTQTCPKCSGKMRVAPRVLFAALILALLPGCGEKYDAWQPVQRSAAAPADLPDRTAPRAQLSPGLSALLVYGVLDFGFAAMLVTAITRARAYRRRARAATASGLDTVLRDGPAEIAGLVELEPAEAGAPVRSFWLRLDREPGIRVRVEPDDQVTADAPPGRVQIREGERVRVTGVLLGWGRQDMGGVYREMAEAPVLRPPAVGPMSIVTEEDGRFASARARWHTRCAIAVALLLIAGVVFVAPAYHLLSLTGTRVTAVAAATRIRWEWVQQRRKKRGVVVLQRIGYLDPYYEIRAQLPLSNGRVATMEDECSEELYSCVRAGGCAEVPFVVSSLTESLYQVGERPTLSTARVTILLVLSAAVLSLHLVARKDRPRDRERWVLERGEGPDRRTGPGTQP